MNTQEAAAVLENGISGVMEEDQTWGGTIRIGGDVIIGRGVTLHIASGSQVTFGGNAGILVLGRLIIEGKENSTVSIGGPGPWGGILAADGGRLRICGAAISGAQGTAITLSGSSRAVLKNVSISNHATAIEIGRSGRLALHDCSMEASLGPGLNCRGGTLKAKRSVFRGGAPLILARDSRSLLQECDFIGPSSCALDLEGGRHAFQNIKIREVKTGLILRGGQGEFHEVRVEECSPLPVYAQAGDYRFTKYRGPPIVLEDGARVSCDGKQLNDAPRRTSWARSWLLARVLQTRESAPLRGCYQAVYAAGEFLIRRLIQADGNVVSCRTWRGLKRGDFNPGVSDVDFIIEARELSGPAGANWLARFWERYRRWKRIFPFLGEALIAPREEVLEYMEHGGVRALELRRHAPFARAAPHSEPGNILRRWTECCYSYARLIEWQWHRSENPREQRRMNVFKSAIDVLRHLSVDHAGLGGEAGVSRKAYWENLDATPFTGAKRLLKPLLESSGRRLPQEALFAEIGAALLRFMHRAAPEIETGLGRLPDGRRALRLADDSKEEKIFSLQSPADRWKSHVQRGSDSFGENLQGALLSDLYPSYFFLNDDAVEKLELGDWLERFGGPPGPFPFTIVLSNRLWPLWSSSPYLENPCLFTDARTALAGRLVLERYQYSWGALACRVPSSALFAESAAQSLAHFKLIWRWLGSPLAQTSNRYTLHYFLSRVLGLRLAVERAIAAPFFNLDRIIEIYRSEFPESARGLKSIRPENGCRSNSDVFQDYYPFLDRELRKI